MNEIEEFLGRISRGEDTTHDDVKVPTIESISLPFGVNTGRLRVPSGQKVSYEVDEDGIVEITDTYDQDGKSMYASQKMIMSKEAFVDAYKRYIEQS